MIHTLKELVDLYEEGKLEGESFVCYITDRHRETDSQGYTHLSEIKALSEFRKEQDERMMTLIWGKK